eukprot:1136978-Pelagomonas_calceolata.AAC.3
MYVPRGLRISAHPSWHGELPETYAGAIDFALLHTHENSYKGGMRRVGRGCPMLIGKMAVWDDTMNIRGLNRRQVLAAEADSFAAPGCYKYQCSGREEKEEEDDNR